LTLGIRTKDLHSMVHSRRPAVVPIKCPRPKTMPPLAAQTESARTATAAMSELAERPPTRLHQVLRSRLRLINSRRHFTGPSPKFHGREGGKKCTILTRFLCVAVVSNCNNLPTIYNNRVKQQWSADVCPKSGTVRSIPL